MIVVRQLKKRFKKREAVKEVGFEVKKGEIFGLIGPDGAGKSTVMKIVAGVMSFEDGTVQVLGRDFRKEKETEQAKAKIAFMPQGLGLNLYPTLSVEENIDFFAVLHDLPKDEAKGRKELLLKVTNLTPFRKREAQKLSGGMTQKLGVCCSLIHKPELLILDEPTTGIDPISRRELWRLIVDFVSKEGMAALISTSYMDEAERFSSLALMIDGEFVAQGAPGELKRLCGSVYEIDKDVTEVLPEIKKKFRHVRLKGNTLRFLAAREIEKTFLPVAIGRVEPNLEDVFLALKKEEEIEVKAPFTLKGTVREHAVTLERLTKQFDSFVAVSDVSFQINSGEIFGLLGPNGAGKTTLIKMLCGLLIPTSGQFSVAGKRNPQEVKEIIGYMSLRFSLYKDLTILENLELYGNIYKVPAPVLRERISWALETTGLEKAKNEKTDTLPLGLKQRLALMCSVLHNPALIFLDEPTSGVDPIQRKVFWDIIHVLAGEVGVTVLVSTHYMDEAEYCDRLCLMDQGEAIAIGGPSKLKEDAKEKIGHIYQIALDHPFAALDILEKKGLYASFYENGIRMYSLQPISLDDVEELFSPHGLKVFEIKEVFPSIEDVFVHLVTSR